MTINPDHLAWCRNLFASLNDDGEWAIPRVGLIFNKRGKELVLVARMPHHQDMPITEAKLKEEQENEYAVSKHYFEAAGIPIKDETS